MTTRGAATRGRLLEATRHVVREVGYPHATTRAIAQQAGVTEATIYRHFPDKRALFMAAVLDGSAAMIAELEDLPERAGHGSVEQNLLWALQRLATLRDDVLPLELAMLTDPQMAMASPLPSLGTPGTPIASVPGPPGAIAAYLAAEQRRGRMRAEVDPGDAAVVLLVLLFGMSLRPGPTGPDADALAAAVRVVVRGLVADEAPPPA